MLANLDSGKRFPALRLSSTLRHALFSLCREKGSKRPQTVRRRKSHERWDLPLNADIGHGAAALPLDLLVELPARKTASRA